MGLVASRLGHKPIQPLDFFECRDGWIYVCCIEEHQWQQFVELMGNPEWASLELFQDRLARGANWDALKIFLQDWMREQTVDAVYRAAQARRVPFAPVSTMTDLLASEHLQAREFFTAIDHPRAGRLRYPGAPYRFGATPWRLARPAPLLGEHTAEVLADADGPICSDAEATAPPANAARGAVTDRRPAGTHDAGHERPGGARATAA